LEVLAGIPTVVYGYFALIFMTPLLRSILAITRSKSSTPLSAGIVVGILIIPLVSSMSEDALHAVPRSLREAALPWGHQAGNVVESGVPARCRALRPLLLSPFRGPSAKR
jgi:ABC-type phosphate transport system permease subunit